MGAGMNLRSSTLSILSASALIAGLGGCNKAATPEAPPAGNSVAAAPSPPPSPAAVAAWVPSGPNPNVSLALTPLPAQPGDIADSHDLAALKRFSGAQIVGYLTRPYDKLPFFDSSGGADSAHKLTLEGPVTRIVYRIPTGHSALEVLRNYQDLAKSAGLAQTSELECIASFGGIGAALWDAMPTGKLDNPVYVGGTGPDFEGPHCYFTARGMQGGKPLMLSVYVAEKHKYLNQTGFDGKPLVWKDGEVAAIVDLIAAKPVVDQMVTVKAADMADALASKGQIALYGILFDTDKADVRPESDATLGEIASLMKIDRSLRLEVAGHTDNQGASAHNLTLSQARAAAVVAALTGKYGIDAKRLTAKGYGDTMPVAPNSDEAGRSKNRRVVLKKQ